MLRYSRREPTVCRTPSVRSLTRGVLSGLIAACTARHHAKIERGKQLSQKTFSTDDAPHLRKLPNYILLGFLHALCSGPTDHSIKCRVLVA